MVGRGLGLGVVVSVLEHIVSLLTGCSVCDTSIVVALEVIVVEWWTTALGSTICPLFMSHSCSDVHQRG